MFATALNCLSLFKFLDTNALLNSVRFEQCYETIIKSETFPGQGKINIQTKSISQATITTKDLV